jgi:TorA maturation chaperone TorD
MVPGSPPIPESEKDVRHELRRAVLLTRLARCFEYPTSAHRGVVLALLAEPEHEVIFGPILTAWRDADGTSLEPEYCRLFLGSAPCPPNETAWGDGRRFGGMAAELADLQGFYRAFGFELSPLAHDTADHLCVELEFLAALLVKDAYARYQGCDEAHEVASRAVHAFLEAHLGRWVDAFAQSLHDHGADSAYLEAARAVAAVVRAECERAGARIAARVSLVRRDSEADGLRCPLAGDHPVGAHPPGETRV